MVRLAPLDPMEALEQRAAAPPGNADAGVADLSSTLVPSCAQGYPDAAVEGELERVGEEIKDIFSHISRST